MDTYIDCFENYSALQIELLVSNLNNLLLNFDLSWTTIFYYLLSAFSFFLYVTFPIVYLLHLEFL